MTVTMNNIQSSSIVKLGYKRRTMNVEFNTGRVYQFKKVPRKIFDELRGAQSVGRYFNDNIREAYPFTEVKA